MSGLAFIDTETTGLDPVLNPIWDIAVILPDGPHEGEHCWQVRLPLDLPVVGDDDEPPSVPYMTEWVLENTGFRDRYADPSVVMDNPGRAIERFAELVDGRHLVGAVPSFDEERLRAMYMEHVGVTTRMPWHYHLIDVEALAVGFCAARGYFLDLPWDSQELGASLGVDPTPESERHTALGDARWARRMYEAVAAG